jgi:hypothetical protein
MKVIYKILLILEIVAGFSHMLIIWLMGLLSSLPILITMFNDGLDRVLLSALGLIVFALGTLGLIGVLQLLKLLLLKNASIDSPTKLKVFLICGYAANLFAICFVSFEFTFKTLLLSLPMIVTVHLIYLSRGYLWKSS